MRFLNEFAGTQLPVTGSQRRENAFALSSPAIRQENCCGAPDAVRTSVRPRLCSILDITEGGTFLAGPRLVAVPSGGSRVRRGEFELPSSSRSHPELFMMDMVSGGMMIGMGLIWLLVIVFLVLGIAASIKYLRS